MMIFLFFTITRIDICEAENQKYGCKFSVHLQRQSEQKRSEIIVETQIGKKNKD